MIRAKLAIRSFVTTALMASVLAIAPAVRAGEQDFTIVNNTGKTIENIYVAQGNDKTWGDDLLGDNGVLNAGKTFHVKFTGYKDSECHFDLRFETKERMWEIEKVDLCETTKLVLTRNGTTLKWKTE